MKPEKLKQWTLSAYALGAGTFRGISGRGWRFCVVCQRQVPAFLPWRGGWASAPPLLAALHMVGSDLDHFACPRCGATDRDRHLRLYLERSGLAEKWRGKRILHFAPEAPLVSWIRSFQPAEHVLADLCPQDASVRKIDLEEIPYEDGHFDWVIANHVLEHVGNLAQATREISRVLAVNGFAVLQTPWCRGLSATIEDPEVASRQARLQLYGQQDHVRLFGRDVYHRIAGNGLAPEPMVHASALPGVDHDCHGVNPDEELMLFRRFA